MTTTGAAGGCPPRLPLMPDIPEGVLPIGTPCEPTRKDYMYITGYRARKIYGPPTRPSGLRMPKVVGIPPLLRLSLVLVPPMLTETITPSHPAARRQIRTPRTVLYMSPSQGRGEVRKVERPRMPNYGIMGYMGGGPWMFMGIQGPHLGNTLSRAHYVMPPLQHWVSTDLHGGCMVSARNSRKPCGQPRNSWKIQ